MKTSFSEEKLKFKVLKASDLIDWILNLTNQLRWSVSLIILTSLPVCINSPHSLIAQIKMSSHFTPASLTP